MEKIQLSMKVEKAPHLDSPTFELELYRIPTEALKCKRVRMERAVKTFCERLEIEFLYDGSDELFHNREVVDDMPDWAVACCESCNKWLEEGDEYTTCDNSGTSECEACEVKRLKLEEE